MPDVAEPPWLVRAQLDLKQDTREVPGEGSNPWILQLYRDLRLPVPADDSKNAWCAVWCCHTLMVSGVKHWRRVQAARGALEWGDGIATASDFIRPGAIVVLDRVDPAHPTEKHGHVGFALSIGEGRVTLISGNSHNRVAVADYDAGRILGARWPKPSDILVHS